MFFLRDKIEAETHTASTHLSERKTNTRGSFSVPGMPSHVLPRASPPSRHPSCRSIRRVHYTTGLSTVAVWGAELATRANDPGMLACLFFFFPPLSFRSLFSAIFAKPSGSPHRSYLTSISTIGGPSAPSYHHAICTARYVSLLRLQRIWPPPPDLSGCAHLLRTSVASFK